MSAKPVEIRVADAIAGDILTLPWSLCVSGQMAASDATPELRMAKTVVKTYCVQKSV